MYCSFFGLQKLPFKISPDLSFFYKQALRDDILQALLYCVVRGDGIVKVVGEVGVGKTTLLRLLAEQLPQYYQKIYISSPNLSALDLLKCICSELNMETDHVMTKLDLINRLNAFLIDEYSQGLRVVMLVDESQSMTVDSLEEIRLLGNLETKEDKLLQIVLFGQPELDITLEDSRVKPLNDRIAFHVSIPPLTSEEVMRYLNYRMRVAGYMAQDLFNLSIAKRIQKVTRGLPRAINLLADKLLMVAYSKEDHQLKLKHFKSLEPNHSKPVYQWRMSFGLLLVVGGLSWAIYRVWLLDLNQKHLIVTSNNSETQVPEVVKEISQLPPFMTPVQLSEKLGVEFDELFKMVTLKQKTERFFQTLDGDEPVILMSAMPIDSFQAVYSNVLAGLSAHNKTYLFAVFELNFVTNYFQYRLLYYPRATRFDLLKEKQQNLATIVNTGSSKIILASEVNQIIQALNTQRKTL